MQKQIDLDLIALAQTGDEVAFTKLYNDYKKHVQYLAYRILNNHHDAQDATQAVFIQVHQSIVNLKCPEYFILWLNRITMGKCNNIYRKKKVSVVDMEDSFFANKLVEEQREFLPDKHMKFRSDKELVDYMIMKLPYVQRQVIVLFYFEELSLQEIADITNEVLGTVKSRLFLAKKKLKHHIEVYQSKEKTFIDFRSIDFDALLVASLVNGFQAFSVGSKASVVVGLLAKTKEIFATSVGKSAVIAAALSTSSIAVVGVYHSLQENNSNYLSVKQSEMAIVKDSKNAQDAYFTLLNWAPNEQVVEHHGVQDIEKILDAYNVLKSEQGIYWEQLQSRGWIKAFENLQNK